MILGIGIDILSLPRLDALVRRRTALRLAERICTARELAAFREIAHDDEETVRARQVRFLSSRWAAKEAAFKSLPPRSLSSWRDLELSHDPSPFSPSSPSSSSSSSSTTSFSSSSGRNGPPRLALVSGPLYHSMRAKKLRKRARARAAHIEAEGRRMEGLSGGFVGAMLAQAEAARGGAGSGSGSGSGSESGERRTQDEEWEPPAHPQLAQVTHHPQLSGRAAVLAAAAAAVHGRRAPVRLEVPVEEEAEEMEDEDEDEGCGVSLLTTISHDAGVVVAAVVAQRE